MVLTKTHLDVNKNLFAIHAFGPSRPFAGGKVASEELWFALKVRPRFERSIVTHLRYRGYDPFLPTYTVKSQWADRRVKLVEWPLFPGYLFCQFDLKSRLPILSVPGVNYIVGIGKAPEPIGEQEIESLRKVVGSGLYYEPHPYLATGQLVRVEQGSLAGAVGRVIVQKNAARLIISIDLLMRSVSTEVDRSWVNPIENMPYKQHFNMFADTVAAKTGTADPKSRVIQG
jgi:transcriptional antiterminator NusG